MGRLHTSHPEVLIITLDRRTETMAAETGEIGGAEERFELNRSDNW